MQPLAGRLSEAGDDLTFVGTTNGLYVVDAGGRLHHFLYSPVGIRKMALVGDITGDGIGEVAVAFVDTRAPALRCHDGATWEELWQYAPMARIWDREWVDRQMAVTGLEVLAGEEGQKLAITSGRSVICIDARDGSEEWRFGAPAALGPMAVLSGLDGEGGAVFAGTNDGDLYWLDGRTGKTRWRTRLPRHDGMMYDDIQRLVSDVAVLDDASGKVLVASADGYAQLYDLPGKRREWETRAFGQDPGGMYLDYSSADLVISVAPDITGDGLPEALLSEATGGKLYYATPSAGRTSLCDSGGTIVWEKNPLQHFGKGIYTGCIDGKPFLLQSSGSEITLIDLKDGQSVLHRVPLAQLADPDQSLIVGSPGGQDYLAFSSTTDLVALSASGEVRWSYPRLGNVTSEEADFVGDGTGDVLFCAEQFGGTAYDSYYPLEGQGVRLLAMMDGATRSVAWSREVPYGELRDMGGLQGMRVAPDLVGHDQVPDIVGYREDTVFIFSGRDGSLTTLPAGLQIAALEVVRRGADGSAIALATPGVGDQESGDAGGLLVLDAAGAPLWMTTVAGWPDDQQIGSLMALDDVSSDNVDELALVSASRAVVFRSVAATDNYQERLTIEPGAGRYISSVEQVTDADRDGIRDLACIQLGQASQSMGQGLAPPAPLLTLRSGADGHQLFQVELPAYWTTYDLSCGDFNGDGYADSLFFLPNEKGIGLTMIVLSGRDGATLRAPGMETEYFVEPGGRPPAVNIGDFDGDGADELGYLSFPAGWYGYAEDPPEIAPEDRQLCLRVYSPALDSFLTSVPASLRMKTGFYGGGNPNLLAADVDGDGRFEMMCDVTDPYVPSYDPDAGFYLDYGGSTGGNLAVVDLDSGLRLAAFAGFSASGVSLFEAHKPGTLGVAARGAACFLRVDGGLSITSPEDGATAGPNVSVTWEGATEGNFATVYVDGVRYDMTGDSRSDLYLGRGNHDITVISEDNWGRVSCGPANMGKPLTIKVVPSPWKPAWLVLSLVALVAVAGALSYPRLHRAWRARRRASR